MSHILFPDLISDAKVGFNKFKRGVRGLFRGRYFNLGENEELSDIVYD